MWRAYVFFHYKRLYPHVEGISIFTLFWAMPILCTADLWEIYTIISYVPKTIGS